MKRLNEMDRAVLDQLRKQYKEIDDRIEQLKEQRLKVAEQVLTLCTPKTKKKKK